jgi:N-glycosylase/DNA lyase
MIKPPTFESDNTKDEYVKTWFLDMRKYFELHNYSMWVEGIIFIYRLKGKASMWWDQFVQVKHIDENKVTWREFKRYLQNK